MEIETRGDTTKVGTGPRPEHETVNAGEVTPWAESKQCEEHICSRQGKIPSTVWYKRLENPLLDERGTDGRGRLYTCISSFPRLARAAVPTQNNAAPDHNYSM